MRTIVALPLLPATVIDYRGSKRVTVFALAPKDDEHFATYYYFDDAGIPDRIVDDERYDGVNFTYHPIVFDVASIAIARLASVR